MVSCLVDGVVACKNGGGQELIRTVGSGSHGNALVIGTLHTCIGPCLPQPACTVVKNYREMACHFGSADSQSLPALFRLGLLELGKRESFTSRMETRGKGKMLVLTFESLQDLFQKKKSNHGFIDGAVFLG